MKKIFYLIAALCASSLFSFNVMAQNDVRLGDKLVIQEYETVDEDGKVTYVTDIKVGNSNHAITYRMRPHYPAFYMGYSRLSNNSFCPQFAAGIGQKQSKSWDWGIYTYYNSIAFNKRGTIGISSALGIGRSSYKLTGGNYFYNDNNITQFGNMPSNENAYNETWFRYWKMLYPINLEFQHYINKKPLFFTFGPELELRFAPKSLGRIDSKKKKQKITQAFDLKPFNVNLMAQVGYSNIGFIAKLSLVDLFQNPMRPEPLADGTEVPLPNCEVYPLTIGFSILY